MTMIQTCSTTSIHSATTKMSYSVVSERQTTHLQSKKFKKENHLRQSIKSWNTIQTQSSFTTALVSGSSITIFTLDLSRNYRKLNRHYSLLTLPPPLLFSSSTTTTSSFTTPTSNSLSPATFHSRFFTFRCFPHPRST